MTDKFAETFEVCILEEVFAALSGTQRLLPKSQIGSAIFISLVMIPEYHEDTPETMNLEASPHHRRWSWILKEPIWVWRVQPTVGAMGMVVGLARGALLCYESYGMLVRNINNGFNSIK